MSDLALIFDEVTLTADAEIEDNDLARDDGLETAVELSLFLDARAEEGDVLPDGETDRRGFWGDDSGDHIGSRLWLLARSKDVAEVLALAPQYAKEALQWMLDDKVSDAIEVTAERVRLTGRDSAIYLNVAISRPKKSQANYRFHYNWVAQEARRA